MNDRPVERADPIDLPVQIEDRSAFLPSEKRRNVKGRAEVKIRIGRFGTDSGPDAHRIVISRYYVNGRRNGIRIAAANFSLAGQG